GEIDMKIPGLTDDAGDWRLGAHQGSKARVVFGRTARASRHTESHQACPLQSRRVRNEGGVRRSGTRPAALDVRDPEPIQSLRDGRLVGHAEVHALGLRAITQGRVKEVKAPVLAHIDYRCSKWFHA